MINSEDKKIISIIILEWKDFAPIGMLCKILAN